MDDRRLHRPRREHRGLPRLQPPDLPPGRARSSSRSDRGRSRSTRPPSWRRRPIAPRPPTAAGSPTSGSGTARVPVREPMTRDEPWTDDDARRPTTTSAACPRSSCTATWRAPPARRPSPTWPGSTPSPSRSRIPPSSSSSPASTSSSRSTTSSAPACARPTTSAASPTKRSRTGRPPGVRYREMFFSPGFVIRLGVPVETVWEGVQAGVLDARQDLDINCRMILDFDKPTGPGARDGDGGVRRLGARPRPADRHGRRLRGARTSTTPRSPPRSPRPPATGCAARSTPARTDRPTTSPSPSTSSGASASTTASDSSTTPSSPPRSSSARSRSTCARRRT